MMGNPLDTSRLVSSLPLPPVSTLLIGVPDSRRTQLFQAALARAGKPAATVVSFVDLLREKTNITDLVSAQTVVRVDSPGKDFETERALLHAGAGIDEGFAVITPEEIDRLEFERGRILYPRQWYLGLCKALRMIESQLPHGCLMNGLSDIAVMFDKPRCHALLKTHGIPVARGLGEIESFDDLRRRMNGCGRVFIKLAHGSSASGMIAYQTNGSRHLATTTVEVEKHGNNLRLYNSRRIRCYQDVSEIGQLVDELCRHRVYVEQWLPKAGVDNRTFDLRVVVIAGRAMHAVVRLGRHPMTNLNLLGGRGDLELVKQRIGSSGWAAIQRTCEEVMTRCFPDSLYAGIDLRISPDYQHHQVLEVNAFGDLLPDVLCDGRDTYESEIIAFSARQRSSSNPCLTHVN
ncbi:MAG TPA: STM4014 family protein [Pyrinomonadaceae bacterium]|nr:STM4014 family protein [Pyrinomonadaceae bacterium]